MPWMLDFTQMHPDKKEQLMKAGNMFPMQETGTPFPENVQTGIKPPSGKLPSNPRNNQKAKKKPYQKKSHRTSLLRIPTQRNQRMYHGG